MTRRTEPPRSGGSVASGVQRFRLDVSYDGAAFRGFAENAGVRTVAGELRRALERVLGQELALTCAGRTDAGVHARGQVVTFDAVAPTIATDRLRRAVNTMLGPAITVVGVVVVDGDFDARFSARWRTYRYTILNSEVSDPFLAPTSWWIDEPLDVDAMCVAATMLRGEHDFSAFCRRPKSPGPVSLVRRVLRTGWSTATLEAPAGARSLCFEITASAFCHQMVRSIVGALVAVGRARLSESDLADLLVARSRDGAPNLAPPHGLMLWEVGYEAWGPREDSGLADAAGAPLLSSAGHVSIPGTSEPPSAIPRADRDGRPSS